MRVREAGFGAGGKVTTSVSRAPASLRAFCAEPASKSWSCASMDNAKRSRVSMAMERLESMGCHRPGNRQSRKTAPSQAVKEAKSTVTSYMMGTKACQDAKGLPPTTMG